MAMPTGKQSMMAMQAHVIARSRGQRRRDALDEIGRLIHVAHYPVLATVCHDERGRRACAQVACIREDGGWLY